MTMAGAIAAGIGLAGFLIGLAEPVTVTRADRSVPARSFPAVFAVPSYREISSTLNGPNHGWSSQLSKLKQDRPGMFDPVVRTPEMKDAALRDRLRTRAFDGAPPVIPHAVEQQSAASCPVCHGEGLKLGDRVATRVSHPHFANCQQCHVEPQRAEIPAAIDSQWPDSMFDGLLRSGPGTRAMPGVPPTIPHTLHLRSDCLSCHGLVTRPGLRTTHPWRQNCVQCHVAAHPAEWSPEPGRGVPEPAP
jgi:cytochrome c-type protein NapB